MTAKFIAEEGALKGLVLELKAADQWVIGRDIDQCDLLIEDPSVSRSHLICRKTEQGYEIENLSQTHPVLVNDAEIEKFYLLEDHDHLKIGATTFLFVEDAPELTDALTPEPIEHETIYSDDETEEEKEVHFDLSESARFILKVIAGPNTGAEFALEPGNRYYIGTDSAQADIIFHDLSVSSRHAALEIGEDGHITIEDLQSRNGVMIDRERIIDQKTLLPNSVVFIGTTSFLVLDREAESQTIMAPIFEPKFSEQKEETEGAQVIPSVAEEPKEEQEIPVAPTNKAKWVLASIAGGVLLLLLVGIFSLFSVKEVDQPPKDYVALLQETVGTFPGVKFTFNEATGKLFLVGHVLSGVEKNELLHSLQGLTFIQGLDDNVVNDEAVWQQMNLLLSKHSDFRGVSMHASKPGQFVLTGYLQTEEQASSLTDYINVHFNYLSLLENRVVVEQVLFDQIKADLQKSRFSAVKAAFSNGELVLTGYVNNADEERFNSLLASFEKMNGVRYLKNFVVAVSPEQGVIDLNRRFPNKYLVTGYSTRGDVTVNVVINGCILMRGDLLDGMTITSIQSDTVFLEKDGIRYKLRFNNQRCFI